MENYFEWDILKNVYLEDSFVESININNDSFVFGMEFVLCEKHQFYHTPKENEQYCYRAGKLVFNGLKQLKWDNIRLTQNADSDCDNDYGNIDSLYKDKEIYHLEGDWGILELQCESVEIIYL